MRINMGIFSKYKMRNGLVDWAFLTFCICKSSIDHMCLTVKIGQPGQMDVIDLTIDRWTPIGSLFFSTLSPLKILL